MNVLSLFDGISCGRVALDRANISVKNYYASEIDKHAIKVSESNYPDIIRLGDVNNWQSWAIDWSSIDLVLAGSPCQGFSFAGKQLAFDDPRSQLFFVFVNILNHVKKFNPGVKFLLENVRMKKEFIEVINNCLGVEPVLINSALVSAQDRKRLYWCNWKLSQPTDKGILLKDVVLSDVNDLSKYIVSTDKAITILDTEFKRRKIGFIGTDSQANRIYNIHGKSVTLLGEAGGGAAKMGMYLFGCLTPSRVKKTFNGQRFNNGLKSFTLTAQDTAGLFINGFIRKLTPVECELLQTLPIDYTQGLSDSQRYKCLGNGWTVDVITHILNCLTEQKTINNDFVYQSQNKVNQLSLFE